MSSGGPLTDQFEDAPGYHSKSVNQLGLVLWFNVFVFISDGKVSLPLAILL